MGVFLWSVLKTEKVGKVELDVDDIVINEELKEKLTATSGDGAESVSAMKGYRNIALFGVDSREGALTKNTRSDTIMIASINMDTGECRLVSVYRDTFLNLSNDSYNKCNAAYAKGGPKQAINMLNMNLDLNVTDFITVGFEGLRETIDALGGVEINVKESEIIHLNNYQISMVGKSSDGEHFTANEGSDYIPVKSAGLQTLNGLQATAYCRIRYVGSDFERTQRQRDVLLACLDKAKKASPAKLSEIATKVFEKTYTSLDLEDIIEVLGNISKYEVVGETGFPREDLLKTGTIGKKGSCVVPADLYENVVWLHEFMFEDPTYEPSSSVKAYSDKIRSETSQYVK
ncbi:MAG: LCP family protein [Lachnospiraceae bacterium]|nr:LCP family protein [Lachnospiraceae bacterium]